MSRPFCLTAVCCLHDLISEKLILDCFYFIMGCFIFLVRVYSTWLVYILSQINLFPKPSFNCITLLLFSRRKSSIHPLEISLSDWIFRSSLSFIVDWPTVTLLVQSALCSIPRSACTSIWSDYNVLTWIDLRHPLVSLCYSQLRLQLISRPWKFLQLMNFLEAFFEGNTTCLF